jgi:hypothetical protein
MKSDTQVRDDVIDELRWDPQITEVYGIKAVANELKVKLAEEPQVDSDVARASAHARHGSGGSISLVESHLVISP